MAVNIIVRESYVTQRQTRDPDYAPRTTKLLEIVFVGVPRFSAAVRTKSFPAIAGKNQYDDALSYLGWLHVHNYLTIDEYIEAYNLVNVFWREDNTGWTEMGGKTLVFPTIDDRLL